MSGKRKHSKRIKNGSLVYYSKHRSEPKREIDWRPTWLLLKLSLPIAVCVYLFALSPFFKIKDYIITGNEIVPSDRLSAYIPFGQSIFTFNAVDTENEILKKIPEIRQIKIYKGIPNALKIVVNEQKGIAVWQSGASYYLLSEDGTIFRDITADYQNFIAYPRIVDNKNLPISLNSKIVSSNFIVFIDHIFQNIKTDANIDPDYFSIDETSVDINLYTKNGFYIKFDTLRDAATQLNNLKLILVQRRSEIHEYIDLRINGWAYIK